VRVAVFGASGTIGRALLPLLAESHDVIGVSRSVRPCPEAGVRWAVADVGDPTAVRDALEGVDVAYYLVHSLGARDYAALDRRGAASLARAAEATGVRQIVYLGGLGSDSHELSEHLRSRRETEAVLASGTTPLTVIRTAVVIANGSTAFETMVALVDRLPCMVCPRWVSTPTQPIGIDDVVTYLAAICGLEETFGQIYEAGGPEVMTYRRMLEETAAARGRHPLIVEVPVLTPRLSSRWLALVTPVNAATARPLVDGLRNPTVVTDERLRHLVPFELTSFARAARDALARPD
jgi:uncharacterized protein YbjT (DUF2867 family)